MDFCQVCLKSYAGDECPDCGETLRALKGIDDLFSDVMPLVGEFMDGNLKKSDTVTMFSTPTGKNYFYEIWKDFFKKSDFTKINQGGS